MKNNHNSNRFFVSMYTGLFLLFFLFFCSTGKAQKSKDIENAVASQNVEKLIKIYAKAFQKNISYLQRKVCKAMAQLDDANLFDEMALAAKSKYSEIRIAAIKAVQQMNDPRSIGLIISALDDNSEYVRNAAIWALVSMNSVKAVEELARRGEKTALRRMNSDVLMEALNSEDVLVRSGILQALGRYKNYQAIEPLSNALNDAEPVIRRSALAGLAGINDSLPLEKIISVALTDPDAEVKNEAVKVLINAKSDPNAEEVYIQAMKSDNSGIKDKAASRLVKLENSDTKQYYEQVSLILLDNMDVHIKFKAAKWLINSGNTYPADIQAKIQKIIDEKSYIELTTFFDDFGRKSFSFLTNIENSRVATISYKYHDFNGSIMRQAITTGIKKEDTIRVMNFDNYGHPKDNKHMCLDKDGNLISRDGNPVLFESISADQKSDTKIHYSGVFGSGKKSYEETKIYPCKDCAEKTKIDKCVFVW